MIYLRCTECGALDFDARFELHYNGQSCREPSLVEQVSNTVQTEFSTITNNWGKWCRNGICDILSGGCECKPVYHWYFRRMSKKRS